MSRTGEGSASGSLKRVRPDAHSAAGKTRNAVASRRPREIDEEEEEEKNKKKKKKDDDDDDDDEEEEEEEEEKDEAEAEE